MKLKSNSFVLGTAAVAAMLMLVSISTAQIQQSDRDDLIFHRAPKPLPIGAVTHDWVSFLGPTHNAVSTETKLQKKFPVGGPKLVWELIKGEGYTSPAIQGDKLVYFDRHEDMLRVRCIHPETGAFHWVFRYATDYRDRYGYSNGPRCSPLIDGDWVYTYGVKGKLHCLNLNTGKVRWMRDLNKDFNIKQAFFGVSATPLVEGDLLIINVGTPGDDACVVGINKNTGQTVWQANDEWGASYASPTPGVIHGERRVFVFAGGESRPPVGGLLSVNPANGKVDFRVPWRSEKYESVNAACPVVIGNQVFISASYKTGGALIDIQPDFSHKVAWTSDDLGTHWSTTVHDDGYLYGFDGRHEHTSSLVCLELATKKVMWRESLEWEDEIRRGGEARKIRMSTARGSLLKVDGHYLCLGEYGHLLWLDLTPKGVKILDRSWLFTAQQTWALPVLSRGLVYISQNERDLVTRRQPRLQCYDLRASE